ncbi:MAG: hemerythrin domain-containing protein [Nitrospinota bacterium]|nr:hemerythrin domain-containing protein [Nitrospinota bacterium]MDH5679366.1 hemerythrin domain-containing protein [Nitrospinota bacterium]MDH5757348.1 hemerythrin domain-containing protein [Nitrospinota bacterium]
MTKLIQDLISEHQALALALDELKKIGISSSAGKGKIEAIKTTLLSHLKREDRDLYPPLYKDAEGDQALKRKLDMLSEDMKRVSEAALNFFDKYEGGGEGLDFIRDFGALVGKLNIRIQWEETQLYPEYDRRHPD